MLEFYGHQRDPQLKLQMKMNKSNSSSTILFYLFQIKNVYPFLIYFTLKTPSNPKCIEGNISFFFF